jgi:hypothetical protein
MDQKEIARRLTISAKTVSTHIQRILGKLGVHSRAEAVALAYREGLIEIRREPSAPPIFLVDAAVGSAAG